jgi:hypothetical protein
MYLQDMKLSIFEDIRSKKAMKDKSQHSCKLNYQHKTPQDIFLHNIENCCQHKMLESLDS